LADTGKSAKVSGFDHTHISAAIVSFHNVECFNKIEKKTT